jgi:hypothetical protein
VFPSLCVPSVSAGNLATSPVPGTVSQLLQCNNSGSRQGSWGTHVQHHAVTTHRSSTLLPDGKQESCKEIKLECRYLPRSGWCRRCHRGMPASCPLHCRRREIPLQCKQTIAKWAVPNCCNQHNVVHVHAANTTGVQHTACLLLTIVAQLPTKGVLAWPAARELSSGTARQGATLAKPSDIKKRDTMACCMDPKHYENPQPATNLAKQQKKGSHFQVPIMGYLLQPLQAAPINNHGNLSITHPAGYPAHWCLFHPG